MLSFDLTTLAGRQACVLWYVGLGKQVREAALLAGVTKRAPTQWRRKTQGYAERLDEAKARGAAMQRRRGERPYWRKAEAFLAKVRRGKRPQEALREMGLTWGYIASWSRCVPGFRAEYRNVREAQAPKPRRVNPTAFAVADGLKAGLTMKEACRRAGIRNTTALAWKYRGTPEWGVVGPHWTPRKRGKKARAVDTEEATVVE